MKNEKKGFSLNAVELLKYQRNRYPFLMIDYVTEVIPGVSAKGYKNLTNNEWYFPVHFVNEPNMPGVLQLEATNQMLTVALLTLPGLEESMVHGLEYKIRCRKEVLPGDRLDIETKIISWKRGVCIGKGIGFTNGEVACETNMILSIPTILKQYLPKRNT